MMKILFIGLITSWLLTRLWIFPTRIIYSTAFESIAYIPLDVAEHLLYREFNIALSILYCLHIYWFGLMMKMLFRLVTGTSSKIEDVREEEAQKKIK